MENVSETCREKPALEMGKKWPLCWAYLSTKHWAMIEIALPPTIVWYYWRQIVGHFKGLHSHAKYVTLTAVTYISAHSLLPMHSAVRYCWLCILNVFLVLSFPLPSYCICCFTHSVAIANLAVSSAVSAKITHNRLLILGSYTACSGCSCGLKCVCELINDKTFNYTFSH